MTYSTLENNPPQDPSGTSTEASQRPALHYLAGAILLLGLVLAVEHWVGWSALLRPWLQIAPAYLAAGIILIFLSYGLRALRVFDYFIADTRGQFGLCLRLSLQHNLLNNLLPMRSGELAFPVLMSRCFSVPMGRSVPGLLWFRFLDLHTLIAFALLAVSKPFVGQTLGIVFGLLWMSIPWLGFRLTTVLQARLHGHTGKIGSFLHRILQSLPQQPRLFWRSWLWTVFNWAIKLGVFAWILTLFAEMPLGTAWIGATLGDFTSVLPIHGMAGAGTYEAGVVAGLTPFGIDPANALMAAVNLHLFVLGCTLLSGPLSLLLPTLPSSVVANSGVTNHD